ncbi:hypothetical protein EXVC032PBaldr_048 [Pelagibacter phage EXVC031P Hodr]|jgi:hypothetical protein|nr:hypothetical protein EXVC032PBaldr_048 [Pelagibacter phage EXVC031P Hodr]
MPDKIIEIADAIKSINPNADFSYAEYNTDEETIANIDWRNTTPISAEDILAKKKELEDNE